MLCAINFLANSAYSSIAPFFPKEADQKGVPVAYIGIIFASYSISMAVCAPMYASMLTTRGSKNVLFTGCICMGLSMLTFGVLAYINNPLTFGFASLLCRVIEGFGNGCLNSACKFFLIILF